MQSIRQHEGWRDTAYQDTVGVWTIGYGTNLQELTIDKALGNKWLEAGVEEAQTAAARFPEFQMLTPIRQDVLVEMVYNMGPSRVAGFKKLLLAIRQGDWELAAMEMLDSKWANQVGQRAQRLAKQMESGVYWNE